MSSTRRHVLQGWTPTLLRLILTCCLLNSFCVSVNTMHHDLCDFWRGSVYYRRSCYKVDETLLSWVDAKTACPTKVTGGFLAEPKDENAVIFLHDLMMTSKIERLGNGGTDELPYGAWIGARKTVENQVFWWLSDDSSLWNIPSRLKHVSVEMAEADEGKRHCLQLTVNSQFDSPGCSEEARSICQVDVNPICPDGERYYDGHCYYFGDQNAALDEVNYEVAQETCELGGSMLVEIHTEGEIQFLQQFLLERLWDTINHDTSELSDHGIRVVEREPFCFLVKGIGQGKMSLNSGSGPDDSSGDDNDSGPGSCEKHINLQLDRDADSSVFSLRLCGCTECQNSEEIVQETPGHHWSFYCIHQNPVSSGPSVTVTYSKNEQMLEEKVEFHNFDQELTFVSISAATFQWKFPLSTTRSIYLGARGVDDTWESGDEIDYSLMGFDKLSSSPGQARLLFQNYPLEFLPSDGVGVNTPILCRYSWGKNYYYGTVPLDLAVGSRLYITHQAGNAVALFNHYPNIMEMTMTLAWIKKVSKLEEPIEFKDERIIGEDPTTSNFMFVVRSNKMVTVELFCTDNALIFSTLIFPESMTSSEYVICAPETERGQILIVNHWGYNDVTIELPKLRQVYIVQDGVRYRPYFMEMEHISPNRNITIEFEGDVSGTTIAGTDTMSIFVITTQGNDVTYDQMLPASSVGNGYTLLLIPKDAVSMTKYKMAALMNNTSIEISNGEIAILPVYGDADTMNVTSKHPLRLESPNPFYASVVFTDGKMSCSTTLLPHRYWNDVYTILLTSDHYAQTASSPSNSHSGMRLIFVVRSQSEQAPRFRFNELSKDVKCERVKATIHYSCSVVLVTGHYVIRSEIEGQTFAAYVLGGAYGLKCYIRMAGIKNLPGQSNGYTVPPFVEPEYTVLPFMEPEECPELETPVLTHRYVNVTLTEEVEEEIREQIREELEIDVHTTSNFVRKKISVPDERTSSKTVGIGGVIIITMVTFLVVIPDGITLVTWVMSKMGKINLEV